MAGGLSGGRPDLAELREPYSKEADEMADQEAAIPMDEKTRMACERTVLAQERTLMAWIRTSTSLITFGFTIYKFFALELGGKAPARAHQLIGPRQFAVMMIAIGLVSLLLATLQNRQYRKSLGTTYREIRASLSSLVAILVSLMGILALAAVLLRW